MTNFNLIFSALTIGFIFIYYFSKLLFEGKNIKNICLTFILFLMTFPFIFFCFKDIVRIIFIFAIIVVFLKLIYGLKTSVILSYIFLASIIYFVSETIFIMVLYFVLKLDNKTIILLANDNCLTNLTIFFIGYAIYSFKFIQLKTKKTLYLIEKDKYCLFLAFTTLFLVILLQRKFFVYGFSLEYVFNIFLVLFFLIIFFSILKEKNKLFQVSKEYDNLLNWLETYEKELNQKRILMHEFKNQIITIKGMIFKNNYQLNNYLNSIIEEIKNEDFVKLLNIKSLKELGWQGLISYKLGEAENKKIKPLILIKKEAKNLPLIILNSKQKRDLLKLIGIYLDNAIEASEKTKIKVLEINVSIRKKEIEINIINSFSKKATFNKLNNRGYGLLLAEKILKNNYFIREQTEVGKFYSKTLIIDLKS